MRAAIRIRARSAVGSPGTKGDFQEATILDWRIKVMVRELGQGPRRGRLWTLLAERQGEAQRVHVEALEKILERLGVPDLFRMHPTTRIFEKGETAMSYGWVEAVDAPLPSPTTGRNESCPCGSGVKYKLCCMRRQA